MSRAYKAHTSSLMFVGAARRGTMARNAAPVASMIDGCDLEC